MKRSDGERVRIRELITRMRSALDSIEIGVKRGPVGVDDGQTILTNAGALCSALARLGAYQPAEDGAHWDQLKTEARARGRRSRNAKRVDQ